MNENLKAIFDSYENEKIKIRKRIDANKGLVKKLDDQINSYYSGCTSIMDKVNARKENKPAIMELEKRLAAAYETEIILTTSLKVANEMKVKAVANALHDEILSNPEKWNKYPLHFQKFKNMVADFLSDTNLYLINSYNIGSYYVTGSYDYHNITGYVFYAPKNIIDNQVLEEMKTKEKYSIIPAADILKECKRAFITRKKIIAKYESVKKAIDTMRAPFTSDTIYSLLPYANSTPENYKRF
jgi:sugar-specific transcriptional regulator TrmB